MTTAVGGAPAVKGAVGPGHTAHAGSVSRADAVALLPKPAGGELSGLEDGLALLYEFQSKAGAADLRDAGIKAASKQAESHRLMTEFDTAMRKQAAAERKAHGFWAKFKKVASTVAKVASLVAGAAAVVGSGGAALPLAIGIAGVALSAGGMAVRELKLAGKDSDKVGMWMELGGAGVAVGGTALAAFGVISAAANASEAATVVGTGASLTQSASTLATGASTIAIADFQRDADHAAADRENARLTLDRVSFERKMIIESAKEGMDASNEALDATRGAMEAAERYEDVAISGVKG